MESKDRFESIIKAKMESLEKAPTTKTGVRLQHKMRKQIGKKSLWKNVAAIILAGSLLASSIWCFYKFQLIKTSTTNTPIASQKEENLQEYHGYISSQHDHFEHQGHIIKEHDKITDQLKSSVQELTYNSITIKDSDNIKNSSFVKAKTQAINEKKLIFLNVYNLDCSHCQKMKDSIFSSPIVQAFLEDHFVRMDIDYRDFERNEELIKYYAIKTVPTFLFVNGDGKSILKINGYRQAEEFTEILERAMEIEAGLVVDGNVTEPIKILRPKDIQLASYQAALQKAKSENKLIFIDFYNKDCKGCLRMKKRTLGNKEVQDILSKHFITFDWDKKDPVYQELMTLYNNPNLLFLDQEGNWLKKLSTYTISNYFINTLNDLINEDNLSNQETYLVDPNVNKRPPIFLKTDIFPNPSSGLFILQIKGKPQPIQIRILQSNGQIIYEDRLFSFLGEQTIEFDLSKYKGQFIIQTLQGQEMMSSTVIIQ